MDCLELARDALTRETGGAFDISLGTGPRNVCGSPRASALSLARPGGVKLDLGGIGKGYAVDRMAEVLGEWDIRRRSSTADTVRSWR